MTSDLTRIKRDAENEIARQLEIARRRIVQQLRTVGSDSERTRLRALQRDVEKHLDEWRNGAVRVASGASSAAIESGVNAVGGALKAAGIDLTPKINPAALRHLSSTLTDLIKDVSTSTKNRINSQIAQVLIGTQNMADAITAVDRIIDGPTRSRAQTILRTELGRIHSAATQEAGMEAHKLVPMNKQWVSSSRKHPRPEHQAANGQTVPCDQPFRVGSEALMHPLDPKGSARNTINCGCRHVFLPVESDEEFIAKAKASRARRAAAAAAAEAARQNPSSASVANMAQGGITPPNIISSPGGILGGGGMLPPMPPNPANPRDPNDEARQSLSRLYANAQALGDVPGRRLVRSLWTNLTSYAGHVEKRIRDGDIASADELARRTLETLAAAELSKIAMYELPTVLLQVTATGWIVLVNANGRIVSSYPFDPDADSFDQRAANWKVSSHDYVLTPADREVLARLFHGR